MERSFAGLSVVIGIFDMLIKKKKELNRGFRNQKKLSPFLCESRVRFYEPCMLGFNQIQVKPKHSVLALTLKEFDQKEYNFDLHNKIKPPCAFHVRICVIQNICAWNLFSSFFFSSSPFLFI